MTPKELAQSYQLNKHLFHTYIDRIKKNSAGDIFNLINPTLIKNPYASSFPKNFFLNNTTQKSLFVFFIKNVCQFYLKNFYFLFIYFISYIIYKIYYKKQSSCKWDIIIDTFGLIENTNKENAFFENYFGGLYPLLEQSNEQYAILLRPYDIGKNPFKMIKFFKIINENEKKIIFEYGLLKYSDFFTLFSLTVQYPFKTLRLLQKEESSYNIIFNQSLIIDINLFSFHALTRYVLGKNIAKIKTIKKIFSWSEFQEIERSFNYAIRIHNQKIKIIACQFYLKYETYFNVYVDDLDYVQKTSPHVVLVNGKHDLLKRDKVLYREGVSLRYSNLFGFSGVKEDKNVLILGSYIEDDTKLMLDYAVDWEHVLFKNHPIVNLSNLGQIPDNITVTNENIYTLFYDTKIVLGTGSGSLAEAVACGISCIVIASHDNLTANPLVEYGKGEIWDIAFSKNDVAELYNRLLKFRKENILRIQEIAAWYKDNFFIEPTEKNIMNVFDLK